MSASGMEGNVRSELVPEWEAGLLEEGDLLPAAPVRNGFYRRFRRQIVDWSRTKTGRENRWVEFLLAGPDLFHLLCALMMERGVSPKLKGRLALVVVYFISPLDFLPEAVLGPLGFVDDLTLAAYVLNQLVNAGDSVLVRRHWAGDGDVLALIRKIADSADEMVGSGLWHRIKKVLGE